ncbi:c6 zinc finger domain containing protein [Grosmannia clavigera kw1407]|uniref:C6 zinc finger domain containing protein n=1 Tax=Grosmannia clavigera (strain kw1407 / UAMH 11150) TaxID=655863 RepID=F0XJ67_GROCL|nr:c6 zinc finger domain containing protein [Grosmannia clavigera kw1407]EFX02063.1 c6 zinc finger domain containing protein [Grosmannia clavigera kw1407]
MAEHCQRSILSCARCRRRKIKCDRQLPLCSQCVAAKSECTGTSTRARAPSQPADVPRSIVQHLESEIARLETELLKDGQLEVVHASDILLEMEGGGEPESVPALASSVPSATSLPLRDSILRSGSLQSVIEATLPYGSGAADLLSKVRMGLTPSSAKVRERRGGGSGSGSLPGSGPLPTKGRSPSSTPTTHSLPAPILCSIPWDIVQRLLRKYLNTIQPDSPFLVAATVVHQFQAVGEALQSLKTQTPPLSADFPPRVLPSHDFLVVYLVLAVSVTLGTANDGHEARCMALSASLFEEGIPHLSGLAAFPSDLAWLQTILLVLLYATVFPRAANVWVLSGVAMRSCLELGLHRVERTDHHPDHDYHPDHDLPRRVFWAAYCMDRSICSVLQRPLSTPDAAINARLPAGRPDHHPFLSSVAYHRLLSEILHVHFHREPVPAALSWDGWLASMERRLQEWYDGQDPTEHLHSDPPTLNHPGHPPRHTLPPSLMLARGLMVLHRPSPRVPQPQPCSLLRAFEAATSAERIHRDHLLRGVFRRPWLSAHYSLEAATVVLFCLRHGYAAIAARFSAADIFDMAKLLTSNLLAIASHGWPEVGVYAGAYERLLGPLLERVFGGLGAGGSGLDLDPARFGPAQDAELTRLLYPGPAHLESLRFGLRQPQQELSPFDFNLFMIDDDMWDPGLLHSDIHDGMDAWDMPQDMALEL